MRRRTEKLRRLLFLCLCLTLLLSGSVFAAEGTDQSAGLSLDVSYGYDNSAKRGRYLPVTVSVKNGGSSVFTGTEKILVPESNGTVYEYDYQVLVRAGETKAETRFIPVGRVSDELYVKIADDAGTELQSRRVELNTGGSTPELFIGILSDTPARLDYLDNVSVNYGQLITKTCTLSADTFPEDETGLDLLDVILISSYRIRNLSVSQTRALLQWVRNGGVMILGTGERASETLGRFAPELLDSMFEDAEPTEIDMSDTMNYQMPGNNTLTIPCVSISLHGGNDVIPGGRSAIISEVAKGRGLIVVSAFDFVDIADYAAKHSAYVNMMLSKILGTTRIAELSSETSGSDPDGYWSALSLISTGEDGRIPNVNLYIFVILMYIAVVGPGLYLFLQRQNRQSGYRKGVIILSVLFTAVIYLLGARTRFHGTFYNYATVRDVSEDSISETTYLNLRNPYNTSYHVDIRKGYTLLPITKPQTSDAAGSTGAESGSGSAADVRITNGASGMTIAVADASAFSSSLFRLKSSADNTDGSCFSGEVSLFENRCTGSVTNRFSYPVEDAALVFYGKLVPLGTLQPSETKDLGTLPIYNIPLNDSFAAASLVTGYTDKNDKAAKGAEKEENASVYERTNLLSFYLGSEISGYTADARVIAFPQTAGEKDIIENNQLESTGITLLSSTLSVNSRQDDMIYRSALLKNPSVMSGDYFPSTNTAYAGEPVVLEYSLGNDITADHLIFEMLDPQFMSAESGRPGFEGTVSVYNYATGNYDDIDITEKPSYTAAELADYISPGNTISVRYADNAGRNPEFEIELPMLTVVGKDR